MPRGLWRRLLPPLKIMNMNKRHRKLVGTPHIECICVLDVVPKMEFEKCECDTMLYYITLMCVCKKTETKRSRTIKQGKMYPETCNWISNGGSWADPASHALQLILNFAVCDTGPYNVLLSQPQQARHF